MIVVLCGPIVNIILFTAFLCANSVFHSRFLLIISAVNLVMGVFNLLPLPALDGGRLMFLLFELIFRKKVPAKYEGVVNLIGLILLLLLMAVVTYSDISKLIGG